MDRVEEFFMRGMIAKAVVILAIGLMPGLSYSQSQGANQGQPMGAPPQLDTSRMQEEMTHASAPAGPLKIIFGAKSSEWTPATLATLPQTTNTV